MGSWEAASRTGARLARPLFVALFAWLIGYVNPLDIDGGTQAQAKRAAEGIAALFYRASDRVTVVLIDQNSLQYFPSRTWPLTYREQGLLLRRVASFEPSAVFIDLLYKNPHSQTSERARTHTAAGVGSARDNPLDLLRPVTNMGVPFYIAGLPYELDCEQPANAMTDSTSVLPAIRSNPLITRVNAGAPAKAGFPAAPGGSVDEHIGMVAWAGCGDKYPMKLGGSRFAATPAYLLFRQYCKERTARSDDWCTSEPVNPPPLAVRWGAYPSPAMEALNLKGLCQEGPSLIRRALDVARKVGIAVMPGVVPEESRVPCPPFNVIPASVLMDRTLAREALAGVLKGRFVFVGADIPGVPDVIQSPVHGQLPGVELHAMALDHLISGANHSVPSDVFTESFVILVAILAAFISRARAHVWLGMHWTRRASVWLVIALTAAAAAVVIAKGHPLAASLLAFGGVIAAISAPGEMLKITLLLLLTCIAAAIAWAFGQDSGNWIAAGVSAATAAYSIREQFIERALHTLKEKLARFEPITLIRFPVGKLRLRVPFQRRAA